MIVSFAPWWRACYVSAMALEMWEWADWLAKHPSIAVEWENRDFA
jgi:hypothetical protein